MRPYRPQNPPSDKIKYYMLWRKSDDLLIGAFTSEAMRNSFFADRIGKDAERKNYRFDEQWI